MLTAALIVSEDDLNASFWKNTPKPQYVEGLTPRCTRPFQGPSSIDYQLRINSPVARFVIAYQRERRTSEDISAAKSVNGTELAAVKAGLVPSRGRACTKIS